MTSKIQADWIKATLYRSVLQKNKIKMYQKYAACLREIHTLCSSFPQCSQLK